MRWFRQFLMSDLYILPPVLHAFAHGKSGINIRSARGKGPRKLKKKEKHKF